MDQAPQTAGKTMLESLQLDDIAEADGVRSLEMAQDFVYREHRPIAALGEHVQSLWELRGPCDEAAAQLISA